MDTSIEISSFLSTRVKVLAPFGGLPLSSFLQSPPDSAEPFADDRIEAIAALSDRLMKDPSIRKDPANVAVAFWLRRANLNRFKTSHKARIHAAPEVVWTPAGRVFHVAPSNVDTLFLYSWALAYLCGNANIVRLSKQQPAQVQALLEAFSRTAESAPCLLTQNRFVTYEHDEEISGVFSAWCDHRIVWGGNATVEALRKVPLNPHASERSFASKFSYSMVKAAAVLALAPPDLHQLASACFNDLFWFDQAACSSPQVMFWVGSTADTEAASRLLLDALQSVADRRGYVADLALASTRLSAAFDLCLRSEATVDLSRSALVTVQLLGNESLSKEICGGGYLRMIHLETSLGILSLLDRGDQTITHFGFERSELLQLAPGFGSRGVDRLIPLGEALAFDPIWDGFDLVEDCMRRISIRI